MQRAFRNVVVGCLLVCAASGLAHAKTKTHSTPPQFTDGAPSVDALLDQFLAALAAKDEARMHRLRVNEHEYRDIIIPGTVKEGEPPRAVDATPSEFFWRMLNQKSEDVGREILLEFGGHRYTRENVIFTKGTRKFGWYTAIGEVRLHLKDESGVEQILKTGSIAEVHGRYKFIGFNYND
jgi:hypothetical protein